MGRNGVRAVIASIATAILLGVPLAMAEPVSRTEYVDRLEKVCKPGAEATQKAMDGVRQDVRKPKRIPIAARKFDRAAAIFEHTVKKIEGVEPPATDQKKLAEWFDHLWEQEDYLKRIAAKLHAGQTIKAQRLLARFLHAGNVSNNVVLAFEFDYCKFKFSRYG